MLSHELTAGYVHRDDLRDRGWRPDAVRRAAAAEGLTVVRRSWVLAPTAHPLLRRAAEAGGRLTCVSAAQLAGAWRPGSDDVLHVAVHPHSGMAGRDARRHRGSGVVPVSGRSLVDPVENVLAVTATCLPHDDALAVWESSLNKGLITTQRLRAIVWRGDRARRLRDEATALSDSGLETRMVIRLRRAGMRVLQQVVIAGRPVDALVGRFLVLQTDGFRFHSAPAQRRADIAHDRRLRLLGYTVFRYDYFEVVEEWPRVEAEVRADIAQGLHLRPSGRAQA